MMVHNTLNNTKMEFKTIEPGKVKMYVCGPTTYNYIHLGNARPIVVFDTIRRYLTYRGYEVTYIQNFTDVDDKIIKRANEENDDPIKLAARYIDEFFKDVNALNVLPASTYPKVSEHMQEIIQFVQDIIDAGYGYEVDGDVYFAVRKYEDYGVL
ncbi:MAG: class I tRNA ligase family protein, partial [Peptococcaceae bacterium]|nr:class I tRNA ligase family protein [Peptococcaceae bacterium]